MNYAYYKRIYPDDVLVYIEEFNKREGTVLFDFVDSNEFELFNTIAARPGNLGEPTMILLNNYNKKTVRENTIYSIKPETIQAWQNQVSGGSEIVDSFLIRYTIDVASNEEEIFHSSVSLNDSDDFELNYIMRGGGDYSLISFPDSGKLYVTIRNVGQGNWNEISVDAKIRIVFDAGAPTNASKAELLKIIGKRNILYSASKPILILSHWDKDHYHSLLGMSDVELQKNFSGFICRDAVPNLTSRALFVRMRNAVGHANLLAVPAELRPKRRGPVFFTNKNSTSDRIVLYNAQQHKTRNISGIALTVKSTKHSVVLSGDAHYEQISRDIVPHLNYPNTHHLVVPHHGGNAGVYIYAMAPQMKAGNAIISVGANRWGHPLPGYVSKLRASSFKIKQTNIIGRDIDISL